MGWSKPVETCLSYPMGMRERAKERILGIQKYPYIFPFFNGEPVGATFREFPNQMIVTSKKPLGNLWTKLTHHLVSGMTLYWLVVWIIFYLSIYLELSSQLTFIIFQRVSMSINQVMSTLDKCQPTNHRGVAHSFKAPWNGSAMPGHLEVTEIRPVMFCRAWWC